MHSSATTPQSNDEKTGYVAMDNANSPSYSLLRDSILAKHAGNTATLFAIIDLAINCLTSQLESVNTLVTEGIPYYLRGLYYFLPPLIPLSTYLKHRKSNYQETYDPDAIELIEVIKKNDPNFAKLIAQNPHEELQLLKILTSYLRYEKKPTLQRHC